MCNHKLKNPLPFKPRVKYATTSLAFLTRKSDRQHDFLQVKTVNAFVQSTNKDQNPLQIEMNN